MASLKFRLIAIVASAILLFGATLAWLIAVEHDVIYAEDIKNDLLVRSHDLIIDLKPLLEFPPPDLLNLGQQLQRVRNYPNLKFAAIFDANHQSLLEQYTLAVNSEQLNQAIADATPPQLGIHVNSGFLFSVERIGDQALPLGYLMLVVALDEPMTSSRATTLRHIMPWALTAMLVLLIVAGLLVEITLRSLGRLTVFTRKVNQTRDYSLRIQPSSNQELAELASGINQMLGMIESEMSMNEAQYKTLTEQQQSMMRLANYDSLTNLPNRQFVLDALRLELARCKRNDAELALLFFDLDGFKGINDSLGHDTGDLVLIDVADRVKSMLREGDLFARLGGDEFLVVPGRDADSASLFNLANRLIQLFDEPLKINGLTLHVGLSIGIACATDAQYQLSQLISNADLAMYRSKEQGRGQFTLFNPDMVTSHQRKVTIANSLRIAIQEEQFHLHYQPKVDRDGRIVGVEALLRWTHPELGDLPPSEFIPIAEQGGKITRLTRWVLSKVCTDLAQLNKVFGPRIVVAMNLSAHDLRDSSLFDHIHECFLVNGVRPEQIEFEVTESAYLENFSASNKFFRRLSNLGCSIALDDFGTGYSSLSYLTQITIDTLKIDRQFVHDISRSERCRTVTGTIIDLAARLNLSTCVEGVENEAQLIYLLSQGCDTLQGYYFSKPLPLDELHTLPRSFTMPIEATES